MRKYPTEFALNVFTNHKAIFPASHLDFFEKEDNHKYHIYGVLLAPKFFIKDGSIVQHKDYFSITLFSNGFDGYNEYVLNIVFAEDLDHTQMIVKSIYPHSILKISFQDEEWCTKHSFAKDIEIQSTELFDYYAGKLINRIKYKVLYIGQSYGKRGERSAIERLSSHETLQKILIDVQRNYPEYEIKLMLLEMSYRLGFGIKPNSVPTIKNHTEDLEHVKAVISTLPEEQQVINITEAAIINYFKPKYNSTFVENFPSIKHKSYKQYFELDYNDLTVELDMEFERFPYIELFTETESIKSVWDFIHYRIENNSDRESMYAMFN